MRKARQDRTETNTEPVRLDAQMARELIGEFERLIRRDPARRGLIGSEASLGPLCAGHLCEAAEHLARFGRQVAVVTGFFVPHAETSAAETDGPPGALLLAAALQAAGMETVVVTDASCLGAVSAAARAIGLSEDRLLVCPRDAARWTEEFFTTGPGANLTHLIAVERAGPSHTPESLCLQVRTGLAPSDRFIAAVPIDSHGRCHNMRGAVIDEHTAEIHRLFEDLPRYRPEAKAIGIGDGGNEIGMGSVLWEELCRRLEGEHAPRIPCRVATDWTIIAGTSNWGAQALAAATLVVLGRADILRDWGFEQQERMLDGIVRHGPAVDGITGRQESTVDGLPFLTYIQPWLGIRRLLELP